MMMTYGGRSLQLTCMERGCTNHQSTVGIIGPAGNSSKEEHSNSNQSPLSDYLTLLSKHSA